MKSAVVVTTAPAHLAVTGSLATTAGATPTSRTDTPDMGALHTNTSTDAPCFCERGDDHSSAETVRD